MIKTKRKGFVLVSVILFAVIMMVLGTAAVFMTRMGFNTVKSDMSFHKAGTASDTGLNIAIKTVVDDPANCSSGNNVEPTRALLDKENKTFYTYYTIQDEAGQSCLIYSMGSVEPDGQVNSPSETPAAKVIKTVVVPLVIESEEEDGSGLGGVTAGNISNMTFNGGNPAVGSNCGPGMVYQQASNNALNYMEKNEDKIVGEPRTVQDDSNIYTKVFGNDIDNWSKVDIASTLIVTQKALTLPSQCTFIPLTLNVNNASCDTKPQGNGKNAKVVIECRGGGLSNKVIDTTQCSEVALLAGNMNVNDALPESLTVNVKTTNNLTVNYDAKGFFAANGDLNVIAKGQKTQFEGIFIGSRASNLNLSGNPQFHGLYFIGDPGSNLSVTFNGNTKLLGAMVVAGNINDFNRNGGGNQHPNFEYNADAINEWGDKYPGFLKNASCGSINDGDVDVPVWASIRQTKISVY